MPKAGTSDADIEATIQTGSHKYGPHPHAVVTAGAPRRAAVPYRRPADPAVRAGGLVPGKTGCSRSRQIGVACAWQNTQMPSLGPGTEMQMRVNCSLAPRCRRTMRRTTRLEALGLVNKRSCAQLLPPRALDALASQRRETVKQALDCRESL
jgi:hypothetical protein